MLHLKLSGFTYAAIGRRAGITRQRVQQILSPPKGIRDHVIQKYAGHCKTCGLHVGNAGHVHHRGSNDGDSWNDVENLELLCLSCHRRLHSEPKAELVPKTEHREGMDAIIRRYCKRYRRCRHCGHSFIPRVPYPQRCTNCGRKRPLGEPPKRKP